MSLMEYKGYHAKIEYSAEDGEFVGHVLGINDVLSFDGTSVAELEAMFHECVDDYLAMCEEFGREPEKEYKGSFNVRIAPELHRQSALEAVSRNISLNQFVQQAIENELREHPHPTPMRGQRPREKAPSGTGGRGEHPTP